MIAISNSANQLRRQWRRQILSHRNPRSVAARKGFVAVTLIDQSRTSSLFVDISNLLVVLLYEDESHSDDRMPLRLCGYQVSRVPQGVQWGGAENSRLFKDLVLAPQRSAHGQRIDRSKLELLSLALTLDRRLSRAARHPAAPWSGLRLPQLWAGFRSRHALRGEGPEFEQACRYRCVTARDLFRNSARHWDGLTMYPLDWVSERIECATAVFAEITPGLRRQVFRIEGLPEGLIGYRGASAFDFYNGRFRRVPRQHALSGGDERPTMRILQNATPAAQLLHTGSFVA